MKKEPKKVQFTNKRGQVVQVWQWTLDKRTTRYQEDGTARFVKGSKNG